MKISVIICAYNSENRICRTFHYLRQQNVAVGIQWEIVLVDNASTDKTCEVARKAWEEMAVPLTIVYEPKPGQMHARELGIATAKGEYLLFCDDDNWLAVDYIQRAVEMMDADPNLGALGGFGMPVADRQLPDWFHVHQGKYACGPCGRGLMLAGAGMTVRRLAYERLLARGFKSQLPGRSGLALSSGDDTELTLALNISGWKLMQAPDLTFKHYMPAQRLTYEYLLRITCGINSAYPVLREYLLLQLECRTGKKSALQRVPQWLIALRDMARAMAWVPVRCSGNPERDLKRMQAIGCGIGALNLFKTGKIVRLRRSIRSTCLAHTSNAKANV